MLKQVIRTSTFLFIAALFNVNIVAQPNWSPASPSANAYALYVDLFSGMDEAGTIYGFVILGNYTTNLTPANIEFYAGQPVGYSKPSIFTIPIVGADIGISLTTRIYNQFTAGYLSPNTVYTIVMVAKNTLGQYSSVEYIHFSTPACPNIYLTTGLVNSDRCVNGDGATKLYTFDTKDGAIWPGEDAGILEGATWTIDWGDGSGSTLFHTSTYENDGPGGIFVPGWERGTQQYTYNTHLDCFHEVSVNVANAGACASAGALAESKIAILHGRDTDEDGNGDFQIDEVGTGITDTIYLCEGYEYTTSIEDISTWDCQPDIYYPGDLPGSPSGEVNDDYRYLQWVYGGASADGATEGPANTITGSVVIGGLGSVSSGGPGLIADTLRTLTPTLNPSAPITIPATCQEGEMFKIYYKNWNICNPFTGTHYDNSNYLEAEIIIKIILAPDAPPSADQVYCEGAVGTLTATTQDGGFITWYSDAALTTMVNIGASLTHSNTAPGVYTYYATETAATCEGPATEVDLTITQAVTNNLLTDNNESFCDNGNPSLIDGNVPTGGDGDFSDDYQWELSINGGTTWNPIAGATNEDYDPPAISATTSYRRLVNSGNCTSTSAPVEVAVFPAVIIEADDNQTICSNSTATMAGSISGGITTGSWSTPSNGSFDNASSLNAVYTPGSDDVTNGSVILTLTSDDPAGPCGTVTDFMTLFVIEDVAVDAGPPGSVCSTGSYTLAGATVSGDYSTIAWSNGTGDGTFDFDNILNPIYTPGSNDISNGSVVLTIDIDSDAPCGDKSDNMTLTVNEQPTADAGLSPDICSDDVFLVGATITGDYASISWAEDGDGSFDNSTIEDPAYTPGTTDQLGATIRLDMTVVAEAACVDATDFVEFDVIPAPAVEAGVDAVTCSTAPFTVSDAEAANFAAINWIHNGGGTLANAGTLTPTYTPVIGDEGNAVTLTLQVTADSPCGDITDTKTLYVDAAPTATAPIDVEQCETSTITLNGTNGGGSETGEWFFSGNLVWAETFTNVPNNVAFHPRWNMDFTNFGTLGVPRHAYVFNERVEFNRTEGEVVWTSESIDISASGNVKISIDVPQEGGSQEPGEQDYIRFYYKINGGGEVLIGQFNDDFTGDQVVTAGGIAGASLEIVVRASNENGSAEYWYFDNVIVRQDDATVEPTVNNTSGTSADITDLNYGFNNFTYVAYGGFGGCLASADMMVTRDQTPGNALITTADDDFCETAAISVAANAAINSGTGSWTTLTGNGVFADPNDETTNLTLIAYGNNTYEWRLDGQYGVCTSADVLTIDRWQDPTVSIGISDAGPLCYNITSNLSGNPDHGTGAGIGTSWVVHNWSGTGATYLSATNVESPVFTAPDVLVQTDFDLDYVVTDDHGCTATDNITITVYPRLVSVTMGNDTSICDNKTTNFIFDIDGGTGNYTIEISEPSASNYNYTVVATSDNFFYTTPAPLLNTNSPYTFTIDNITDGNGCTTGALLGSSVVTVGANLVDADLTGAGDFCFGAGNTMSVSVNGGAPPYILIIDTTAAGGLNPGQITISNYFPGAPITRNMPVGDGYEYTLVSVEDACNNTITNTVDFTDGTEIINIKPLPDISATVPATQTICNNAAANITLNTDVPQTIFNYTVSSVPAAGYSWTAGKDPVAGTITDADANSTEDLVRTLQHDHDAFVTVTYAISSVGPGVSACAGNSVSRDVIVEPTPAAAISNNSQVICDGAALTGMTVSSIATHDGTPIFDMVIVATTGSLGDLVATGIALTPVTDENYPYTITGTLTNNTDDAIVIEYRVTPQLATCSDGDLVIAEVTIEPTPKAEITNNIQTICDGAALTTMVVNNLATHDGTPDFDMTITAITGSLGDLAATGTALATVSGGSYPYSINGTLTNNTDNPITIEYEVTPKLTGCASGLPVTATVTIEPTPKAAISNSTQVICDGAAITNMDVSSVATHAGVEMFDMTIVATTGNLGDLVATGTALTPVADEPYTYTINGTLTNNTDDAITIEYRVIPQLTGCADGAQVTATVTIEPTPKAAISNDTQTLCDGEALTTLTVSDLATHNGTPDFNMTIVATTGSTANLTATGNALTAVTGESYPYDITGTLTNNTDDAIVFEYRVTPLLTGCTSGSVVVAEITVEPTPKAAISNSTQVICDGAAITDMDVTSLTTSTGVETFDMAIVATTGILGNLTSTGVALNTVSGGSYPYTISGTLANNTDDPITIEYRVTPKLAGCASGTVVVAQVTIEPTPKAAISNSTQTICDGAALTGMTVTSVATHNGTPGFDMSITATTGSLGDLVATGNALNTLTGQGYPYTISGTLTNNTDAPITIEYRVTPTLATCSDGADVTATVTVEPTPKAAISNNAQVLCDGGSLTGMDVTSAATPTGTETFDMAIVATTGNLGDLVATGNALNTVTGGSYTYTINGTLTNNTDDLIVIEYRVTPKLAGCSDGAVVTAEVQVEPTPKAAISNSTQTICDGDLLTSMNVTNVATHSGTPDFDMAIVATSGNLADLAATGNALTTLTAEPYPYNINGTLTNNTDVAIVIEYRVTPNLPGCGSGAVEVAEITIEPTPKAAISNNTQTICDGASLTGMTVSTAAFPTGVETFNMTIVATTGNLGDLAATGDALSTATGQAYPYIINGTLTNNTDNAIVIEYRVVPLLAGCSNGATVVAEVTIEPTPKAAISNNLQTLCDGDALAGMVVTDLATHAGASSFDLAIVATTGNIGNLSATGTALTTLSGQAYPYTINGTLTNNTNSAITIEYRVTPKLAGCSNGTIVTATVTIEPTPIAAISNSTQDICSGSSFTDMVITNLGTHAGVPSYNLAIVATTGSLGDLVATGNALTTVTGGSYPYTITGSLTNNSFATIVIEYRVSPLLAGCSAGATEVAEMTIYPKPTATPTPLIQTIPNGGTTDITMGGNVTGTVFSWRVLDPGTTGATDGGPIAIGAKIAQTLNNLSAVPIDVTYRIGPSANGCPGDSADVVITIDPSVDITVVNVKPDICAGDNTQIDISSNVTGATFTWTVTDLNGLGATPQPVGIGPNTGISIQEPLTNTSTVTDSVIYHITPTGPTPTFITGPTEDVKVYVYPTPLAQPVNNRDSICNGADTDILMSSDVAGTTFTWTILDPSGASGATASGAPVGIGSQIIQTLDNLTSLPITVTYQVRPLGPAAGSCPGAMVPVEVVVDPTPTPLITNTNAEFCSGESTLITLNSSVVNSEFTYTVADPKGTGAIGGTGVNLDVISQQLFNASQTPVNIIYQVEVRGPGATACPGTTTFENIQIGPLPNTTPITGVDTVCEETSMLFFETELEADSYFEWFLPATLGTRNFGGSGTGSNAIVITAASIPGPAYVTDSMWVFETNVYGCTNDTIYKPLTIIPFPVASAITGPTDVCALATETYSVPNNPGSTYQWFAPVGAGFATDPSLNTVDINFGLISGNMRVIETTAGGCVTNHIVSSVTVHQLPVTTLNADKTAICDGETVIFTAGPTAGMANFEFFINGVSVQSDPVNNIYSSNTLVHNDAVTVNVTSTLGCESESNPVTMTVNADLVVTLDSDATLNTICDGEPVTFTAASAGAVFYNFFHEGVSVYSGPLFFWTAGPGVIANGDDVYVEVQNGSGCFGTSNIVTTFVNDLPTAFIDGDYTICPGDTRDITVTLVGAGPFDVTIDNGVGLLLDYASGTPIPVTPPSSAIYSLSSVTDDNGCTSLLGPNLTGDAIMTLYSGAQILTQPKYAEVCEGVDTSFTVGAMGDNLSYEWYVASDFAGPYVLTGGNSQTLDIVAPTAALDSNYYMVRVMAQCDDIYSDTVMLDVKIDAFVARDPVDAAICEGLPTGFGVDAGTLSTPGFQWYVDPNTGTYAAISDIGVYTGSRTDSLKISSASSAMNNYLYYVEITSECSGTTGSNPATLVVNDRPEITQQPVNADICELGDTLFYVSPGITINPLFQWYVDANTGSFVPVTNTGVYSGATDSILILSNVPYSMDNYKFRVEVSGDCGSVIPSNVISLTVARLPEIVADPADTTTCEMKNVSFTIDPGDTESPVIQWYEDRLDGSGPQPLTDGGNYIGVTMSTVQIFGVDSSMTGYEYSAEVSNACQPAPVTSTIARLFVLTAPGIWEQPSDSTICEGGDATFTVVATGESLVYRWFVNDGVTATEIVNGDGLHTGQGTATLQLTGVDRTHHLNRYYVRIEGTCLPPVQSNVAFLYVDIPPEISTPPADLTICEFGTAQFTVAADGTGREYQWYESPDGVAWTALTDGGSYIGTQLQNLNIFNIDSLYNNYQYRVVVTGTCLPDDQSADVVLTVKTSPEILTQPDNLTVCDGLPANFSVHAKGSELTYQWRVKVVGGPTYVDIPAGDTDYSGQQSKDLTKLVADFATENGNSYRVLVSGPCGSELSNPVLMNVNSLPEIITQPTDDAVCEGSGASFEAFATGPDLVYQWWMSTDNGATWSMVPDDATYEGVNTEKLEINNTIVATMNNNLYRLDVGSSCTPISADIVKLTVFGNPTANITGDIGTFPVICGGDLLTLNGNPAGGSGVYTKHVWTGDVLFVSPTSTTPTPTFQTNIKDMYDLIYTVTDNNNCIGQATATIENYRPTAKFSSDAAPACGDLTVNFTNESTADAVSFNWNFSNGSSTDVNPTQHFDNIDPTGLVRYYQITLTATDAQGCSDETQSVVTVYPKVNPTITATPSSGCQPLSVLLTAQEGAAGYSWKYGDGLEENGTFVMYHVYTNLTTSIQTYETVLFTTSAYGCIASDTIDIVVNPIPKPIFNAVPALQVFPETGLPSVTFRNTTDPGPWTFEYDFGDGSTNFTTSTQNDVMHDYAQPGIFTVTLYSNIGDCRDSAKTAITITPRPPEALYNSVTEGCHPLEVQFFNTSKYATNYTWQFGDGSISTQENPIHTFYDPSTYTVKLVATGPGGTDQTSSDIQVNPTPQVFFNYAPDSVFVNDKPVRFFNLTSYADDYYWDFGDINETPSVSGPNISPDNNSTLPDPVHVYQFEGWKDVLLVATNEYCEDSLLIPLAIKVIPAGALRFPNIFRPGDSPNGGSTTNLSDPAAKNSVFFPGVNKQVTEYHLYIYSRWGQLLFESNDINIGWDGFVNDRKAAQGVYIWKVTGVYSNGSPFSDAGDVTLVWH